MIYTFEDKETLEQFELSMSYDELILFLEENKQVHQVFKMTLVDPVGIGVTRPPSDFQKYVLGKVKQMPGANKDVIEKRWQITKEI
ncbi:hypothetical protein UFOVP908_189 [uncultured Caudovirales phage]|jgi:hypothetical protein|uniref:Uncharacterized protein n=1 Tax=uncultured Caudovirales phage TaxID=2100421 RepID=A0A6J5QC45_9CAUD|nr:hypothetical protein UFOVP908_189 [uncultured Caudovirales phage]CAB4177103.1 hypothetical protein UFOVP990_180 [uncultured Caudovirales phage]CAB4182310.1 hypothetical protein UFOVP1065_211 [uncultured Caudovirales phage]CAB4190840.1 hypothetical protein UFOVP1198_180 [uncultured Caudovirales phage]CAB4211189.1 hypothetical protein UFOVP1418_172 [uncultured Caudovirales phage]